MADRIPRDWRSMSPALRRPRVVEALSVNDDFTDRLTDLPTLLDIRRPAFGGAQEVKRTRVRGAVRKALGWRYGVYQDRRNDGAAGVAVFWDRLLCRPLGKAQDDVEEFGRGWLELTPAGSGLLARGVVWQDLIVRVGWVARQRIRLASAHRPPRRDDHLWPQFDAKLAEWARNSPLPVLILMDCNQPGGPNPLAPLSGLRWVGIGIDGALTDLRTPTGPDGVPKALPRRHSDHRAVSIPIRL